MKRMRKEKMKAQSQKILENIFDLVLDRVKSVFFLIEGNRISKVFGSVKFFIARTIAYVTWTWALVLDTSI